MAEDIVVTIAHDLGAEEAQRRISSGLERLRTQFAGKLSTADVVWEGPHADLRVGTFGQIITAQLDVEARNVRVAVQLPRILAALAKPLTRFLEHTAPDMLQLPPKS